MKRLGNKGIALMLVLSALVILTTMAVEFAYNTNVARHLALNERDRLQSYYLARSAYNFMLLELKFDKMFRRIVQQQNLGQFLGANAQLPLCQQFPMSTGLIRAVFLEGNVPGGVVGGEGGGEEGAAEGEALPEEGAAEEAMEEMRKGTSIAQEKNAAEFLEFEGDFDGECADESTKLNLNGFAGLSLSQSEGQLASPYDQYKQYLFRFLSRKEFEPLFEKADVRAADVVNNIGDWIDTNLEVNEFGGKTGGAERSAYDKQGVKYSVSNGKLITLLEAYLIDGVVDDWFGPLTDYFTVYGDGKVNVCTAEKGVKESLIRRYVDSTPNLPPLRLEDEEEMDKLTKAIDEACAGGASGDALNGQIAQAFNAAIGSISSQFGERQEEEGGGRQEGEEGGFGALISTEPRYYMLKLTGQVRDVIVRIKAVVDAGDADPKKWKLMYWRVY